MNSQAYLPAESVSFSTPKVSQSRTSLFVVGETEQVVAAAPGPGDNLPYPIRGIGSALGVLRCKALVGVFMSRQNQVGVGGVQVFPEMLQFRMYGVFLEDAAAEERMVAIREDARAGMLRKILFQPRLLW